jgi:signal transduction histidine kinase
MMDLGLMMQRQSKSHFLQNFLPFCRTGRLPLKVLLIIPFCIEVSLAIGLTAYWSIQNGQQAVHRLIAHIEDEAVERLDLNLMANLRDPQQVNAMNAQLMARGVVNTQDLQAITQQLWHTMRIHQGLTYINFASPQGLFVGIERLKNGDLALEVTDPKISPGKIHRYSLDGQGQRIKRLSIYDYEAQTDDWYVAAWRAKSPTWSPVYIWETGEPLKRLAISASYPIYDAQSKAFKGVIGVDLLFDSIQMQLQQMQITKGSNIYLLEANGSVIASSAGNSFQNVGNQFQRLSIDNTRDPVLQSLRPSLKSADGVVVRSLKSEQTLNGQPYVVRVVTWEGLPNLEWRIVLTIPRADLMAEVDRSTQQTLVICALALLGSILLGIVTTKAISRPVRRLADAAERFSVNHNRESLPQSPILELNALSESFDHMGQQLQVSFAALASAKAELEQTNLQLEDRVRDRTHELTQAMDDLKSAEAQLIQTEKMSSLGQMLAGIAHEINNPTAFVYGNLDYIQEYMHGLLTLLDMYQKRYPDPSPDISAYRDELDLDFLLADLPKVVGSMREGTERIRNIVQNLRNFSRIDGLEMQLANLNEAIESTLMILDHRLKGNGSRPPIQIVKNYSTAMITECYPGLMGQVFVNLLSNAVDALDEAVVAGRCDRPEIVITTEVNLSERSMTIRVRDNGPGIPAHVRQRMFDPFFTTKPVGKGTGLGLAISYQIITEKHRGQLLCNSDPAWGTEFVVMIPLQSGMSADEPTEVTDINITDININGSDAPDTICITVAA